MVSMKDIARRCGVSVATVSKALNGQPDIAPATRDKIRAAAKEMDYQTNALARALKTNRTYNLGVLFVDERRSGLAHEYFSTVLESFKVTAESHGYDITFITRGVGGMRDTYLKHCRYRGVDGVVIACVDFQDPQVVELVNSDIPLVTIDHSFNSCICVQSDNVSGVEALVRYVHSRGHRKIAFLHGENTVVTRNRLVGFYRACEALGIQTPEEYILPCVYHDTQRCEEATAQLLALPDPPTCILFPDDFSALGGINAIHAAGLRLGEDISGVGYDGIHLAKVIGLTTYSQNALELGRTAADQLVSLIERPRTTLVDRIQVPGSLYISRSVKDIRPESR